MTRLGRGQGAGSPPQLDAILPPAIEPDYRGFEHLLYGMHVSIVGAPRSQMLGMHGVDQIIVASRPSRVVVLARRILDEQAIQSVSINDAPQMCMKFCIRVLRSWCWRRGAEVKKGGSLDDVHVEARHKKLRQTERGSCSPPAGTVCR